MTLNPTSDPAAFQRQSKLTLDFVTAALRAGDAAEAQRLLRERLAKAPRDAAVLARLAEIAADQRRFEEATILLRRAADSDGTPRRYVALLHHLRLYVGPQAVVSEVNLLPQTVRQFFDVRLLEAFALGVLGEHEREIAIYESLTRVAPENETLWKTLGDALKTVGRLEDAVAALREAIRCRRTYGEAYWTLANFKAFKFTDADLSMMRRVLKKKLCDEDALHIHFAMGKALEDRNLYQQSFRHYAAGNAIRAAALKPAEMFLPNFVPAAVAALTADFFERRKVSGWGASDPIFVLGLHRSGSTLIEQILATHPLIEGTTEITVMQQLWERLARAGAAAGRGAFQQLALLDAAEIHSLGKEYDERTRGFRRTDRPYFVDKLPANWMNLGLIRLALPNAKIIDARRHPMACGFSNFKQNYATGVGFSYSQESIGAFYRDYWRFMSHFDEVQPGAVHRVINERLIDDPEGEVRRMLDYIGVPFDPVCLQFYSNKRAVRTPSAEQVRRPMNRDGVDQWKNYEPWLSPLKAALGPALEQWNTDPGSAGAGSCFR